MQAWFQETEQAISPIVLKKFWMPLSCTTQRKGGIMPSFLLGSSRNLGILSVADDLEAMGTIGIYRYAEIYLLRDISLENWGNASWKMQQTGFRTSAKAVSCLPITYEVPSRKNMHFDPQFFEQSTGNSARGRCRSR